MRCPGGSIEVVFDEVASSPQWLAPALVDGDTGIPGCTLDCLVDECDACPTLDFRPVVEDSVIGTHEVSGRMIFRGPGGEEIQTVSTVELPDAPAALELLEMGVLAAEEYMSVAFPPGPLRIDSSPATTDAAAAVKTVLCPGVRVNGAVGVDALGAPSFDGGIAPDDGSLQALPEEEQRKVGFVARLLGLLVPSRCDPSSPVMLASIQGGPTGGGAALSTLAASVPLLRGWAQSLGMRVDLEAMIRPATRLARLGNFSFWKTFEASGSIQAQVNPQTAKVVIQTMRVERELWQGAEISRSATRSGMEAWQRLSTEQAQALWEIYRRAGPPYEAVYREVQVFYPSPLVNGSERLLGTILRGANGFVTITPAGRTATRFHDSLPPW